MSKRKSNNFISEQGEQEQHSILIDSQNISQDYQPAEKKTKRFSKCPNDLSQLNDIRNPGNVTLDQSQINNDITNAPCNGIIENVKMKNFKCHTYFDLRLHPYINFIIGRNGSGKSAVMDAIILCLGGRTTTTGRQASVKSFIKRNTETAELSVTLRNIGEDSYKPEEYGKRITIERKFNTSGASSYKILNENNKVVSTKKQEVDNIIEQFNIQVSNPICFLNQETSKHFLNSSKDTDKYQFFLKSSQIESMQKIQEKTEQMRKNSLTLISEKKKEMELFAEELYECKQKHATAEITEKLRKKLSNLMSEYVWAVIIGYEKELNSKKQSSDKLRDKNKKYESKIRDYETELNNSNVAYKSLEDNLAQFKHNLQQKTNLFNKSELKYKDLKEKYASTGKQIAKLNLNREKKLKNIEDIEKKLNEQVDEGETDYKEERKQKEEAIVQIELTLSEKMKNENSQIKEIEQHSKSIEIFQNEADEKKASLRAHEKRIENFKNEINNLKSSSNDQIYRYGPQMANLVRDIETYFQQSRFRQKPRGPIGMYIKSKNDEYSLAIEQCLGGLLRSFICANYPDEKILQELIRKHFVKDKPSIIVTDFNDPLYDHTKHRPATRDYPTVYEMLDIQDAVVANTLMDQRSIETVFLLPNYETARRLVGSSSSSERIQAAYTPNGDQFLGKPSFRTYACPVKSPRYFIKNTQNLINSKMEDIKSLAKELPILSNSIQSLNKEIIQNKQLKDQNDKQLAFIRKEINLLKNKLDDAKNIYIPEPVNLTVYNEELNKLRNELVIIDNQIKSIDSNSSVSSLDFEKARQDVENCKLEREKIESDYENYKSKIAEIYSDLEKNQESINHYVSLKNKNQIEINQLALDISESEKNLEDSLNVAQNKNTQETTDRIETSKKPITLDNEINQLEKEIESRDKLYKNQKEIGDIYKEKRKRYKESENEIKKQEFFLKKLNESLKMRSERLDRFTESKALKCVNSFTSYLNSRGYGGHLKFNHREQTLRVNVSPNKGVITDLNKDVRSLSGGERSFSTVSFLLSLWSMVESPILFLDEFDVFMDQLNRNIAIELIIHSAKVNLNSQYVFLTPQETSQIDLNDKYIKVYRMPDPKRSFNTNQIQNEENLDKN